MRDVVALLNRPSPSLSRGVRTPDAALASHAQLLIPAELAHDTVDAFGEVGQLQFKDLNTSKSAFQRTYANQVREMPPFGLQLHALACLLMSLQQATVRCRPVRTESAWYFDCPAAPWRMWLCV